MAKIQIKSEKLTPFGGIFHVMELFERHLSHIIDGTLGKRSVSIGYDYSEIIRSLMCVYFCGGSCVEDVSNHLMGHLSLHPLLRTCSSDTILRMMKELSCDNITYTSDTGRDYDFNTCDKVNELFNEKFIFGWLVHRFLVYWCANPASESVCGDTPEDFWKKIQEVKKLLKDNPKLCWMFENCFPNTLETTARYRKVDGDDDTFVYTGDIPAMWLRDSGA